MIPSLVTDHPDPAYSLTEVIAKVQVGYLQFRGAALDGAGELGFSPQDVIDCLLRLTPSNFVKSMDAVNPLWAGCRQDVYKTRHLGKAVYLKFQYWPDKTKKLFIVSFKRNTDGHSE
jgi:hypothetical protein